MRALQELRLWHGSADEDVLAHETPTPFPSAGCPFTISEDRGHLLAEDGEDVVGDVLDPLLAREVRVVLPGEDLSK